MKLKILLPLMGVAVLSLLLFRSCNTSEVVVEDNSETIKVKQMMNDLVLQQQQSEPGAPGTTPAP